MTKEEIITALKEIKHEQFEAFRETGNNVFSKDFWILHSTIALIKDLDESLLKKYYDYYFKDNKMYQDK